MGETGEEGQTEGESADESGVKKGNAQSEDGVGETGEEGQTEGESSEQEKNNGDDKKAEDGEESVDQQQELSVPKSNADDSGDSSSCSVSDPSVKPQHQEEQQLERDTLTSENSNDSILDLGSPVKNIDFFTLE